MYVSSRERGNVHVSVSVREKKCVVACKGESKESVVF